MALGKKCKPLEMASFYQKCAMLLSAGYDVCAACEMLAVPSRQKHDHTADGIRKVANMLLPELREGFTLHEAMMKHPEFSAHVNQVEVGETSGRTSDVLDRLCDQIKNSSKVMKKLRGAMTYPIVVLCITFAASAFLFTSIMPEMFSMMSDMGSGEVPATTQMVMNAGNWIKGNFILMLTTLIALLVFITVYAKTIGRMVMSKLAASLPLVGKVIENNSISLFLRNWQQMLLAGAEMSMAMKSGAESVTNTYIQSQIMYAQADYAENGAQVFEALRAVSCLREMELQTIQVGIETGSMSRILGILADDREYEAEQAVNAFTAALNPILLVFVACIVGVMVLSVYEPILSLTNSMSA